MDRLQQAPGERPAQDDRIRVLNPRARVPLSFIIDDSTCLVNLNRFAVPQFNTAHGATHSPQAWRDWPHEIPDDFVRKFGEWSGENGVKGKYSIVPYPACVGRVDRVLPGWTEKQLHDSLDLVRTLMVPNWDIHPEMVTHTWVIDTKTGQPYPEQSLRYQENWEWTDGKSVDEIAEYMAYGLTILKNVGLHCDGLTTPGGFASRVLPELAQATLQSVRDVHGAEIPHYFRHARSSGEESVVPRVEYAEGLDTDDPRCVVSIIGCTSDWTGGWDCSSRGHVNRFITPDLASGRMVDVIERGEPAVMVCHWTGIYFNGEEVGFNVFKEAVRRIHARYDNVVWMKNDDIARYWAAKELTATASNDGVSAFRAPYGCPDFTVEVDATSDATPMLTHAGAGTTLRLVADKLSLVAGTYVREGGRVVACFDLPKGSSSLAA
ncbi:hypothetical protein HN371_21195 [Candidatus Poribacteria bacterium]|nr:hypothetical protein [Candidatus Poribacteria bacterium]MBT5532127.1 hypothetical protein [Candidatus Poribacteria bacterium]MBT5711825.1 hypothetical protein [Candidatus Poribacteria bacterium]MBT7099758.1 hypothetical protein [Candidatus Poribacteria bacterium]MBT7807776.1 hypothetical protein [Candidatus Poribacteria bacterium]